MVVDEPVEGDTETVDKAHHPEPRMRAGTAAPAEMGLDDTQQDVQHGTDGLRRAAADFPPGRAPLGKTLWPRGSWNVDGLPPPL